MDDLLLLERAINKRIALDRDSGLCAICYFEDRKRVQAVDVHHVYRRARKPGSYRENYKSLMCLCRKHHDNFHSGRLPIDHIEEVLRKCNDTPINQRFEHEE